MSGVATAIEVDDLRVRLGTHDALDGVSLSVPQGSVLGLLGHNGAGKTTLVRVLATLIAPSGGSASVAGWDVVAESHEVRKSIALAGQYAAIDDLLTGFQNLELLGRLSHLGVSAARARAGELLEQFDLQSAAHRRLETYSGGMKRRLDLAACLITRPSVLFLDEPTTGLDPVSRAQLWSAVRQLVAEGVTVLLTTQYLEEAEQLADQIVLLKSGKITTQGTPHALKQSIGLERIVIALQEPADAVIVSDLLCDSLGGSVAIEADHRTLVVETQTPLASLNRVSSLLMDARVDVTGVTLRAPSLDEVFVRLS